MDLLHHKAPTNLGTERVSKLLMNYAVPSIIAMTAASLYNVADSIVIGRGVGSLAIAAIGISFPFMNIATAIGTLVGAGASALLSIKLGKKDYPAASHILGNVVVLNILLGLLFTAVTVAYLDPILHFFGASDNIIGYAHEYMLVVLLGNVITHLYFGLNALLRASGHPRKAMCATLISVALNIVLDVLFVFGLEMGVRGAAIATVLTQVVLLVWMLYIFSNKNELLHFRKDAFKLRIHIMLPSLGIGLGPFLQHVGACIVVVFVNQQLNAYGSDLAIGAYSLVNRVVFIAVMMVMGFNQGMQPIVGYNYGARQNDRVIQALKLTIYWAVGVTSVTSVLGILCPRQIMYIFTSDPELIGISAKAFRIIVLAFMAVGFQITTSNFFQSIGKSWKAIFLSVTRQILFLLPCLILIPPYFGLDGVWYSMPISDGISAITTVVMLAFQLRSLKKAQAQGQVVNVS